MSWSEDELILGVFLDFNICVIITHFRTYIFYSSHDGQHWKFLCDLFNILVHYRCVCVFKNF